MSTFSEPPDLNRRIAAYSEHADEQAAYELMQLISFEVAEFLMKHPRGTMAAGIQGHAYWVSQMDGMVGKMLASPPVDSASQVPGVEVAPDCQRVTKVTQNLQRPDGSQVRIVAEEFYGRGLHPSIDVLVLKRESKDHDSVLCSDRPASNWRSMSVEEYKLHGRSLI